MEILHIVLPVFLVIGLGYLLGWLRFIDEPANVHLSRIVFYVSAPALLFRSAAITPLAESVDPGALLYIAVLTLVFTVLVYAGTKRTAPSRRGVLTQGAHRSNMVFVGLPVIINAYGEGVIGPAAILIGVMVIVYNLIAVAVLILPHDNGEERIRDQWIRSGMKMLKNPLILSCGAGILFSALGWGLPKSADRALELVGRIAMPLALLSVGAGLDLAKLKAELFPAAAVSAGKLILYPGMVYGGLFLMGKTGVDLYYPVLLMASPTAVVSYIMAKEMRGDQQLAAAVVIATTLGSLLTISGWLLFFRLGG